jgi:general secretion pathway protein N
MAEWQMTGSRKRIGALIATAAIAAVTAFTGDITRAANDPLGLEPDDGGIGQPSPLLPGPAINALPSSVAEPTLRGNPLWGITVESLSATRERPLFSPSRRPPASTGSITPIAVTAPPEPEKPPLDLIGIVTGSSSGEGYAVFINTTTHAVISLRTGEGHDGWVLLTANGREAVLERHDRTVVVSFPKPGQNSQ